MILATPESSEPEPAPAIAGSARPSVPAGAGALWPSRVRSLPAESERPHTVAATLALALALALLLALLLVLALASALLLALALAALAAALAAAALVAAAAVARRAVVSVGVCGVGASGRTTPECRAPALPPGKAGGECVREKNGISARHRAMVAPATHLLVKRAR